MTAPTNILQAVQTYQPSELALFQNSVVFFKNANTKFKDFQKMTGNLGDTVQFDQPPNSVAKDGLVVDLQPSTQLVESLTVDRAKNVARGYTAQQYIFNLEQDDYMKKFGNRDVAELASVVEEDIAQVAIESPYRYYGDGVTQINSRTQLATALAQFRNIGTVKTDTKGFLPDLAVPAIIGQDLSRFIPNLNDEVVNSWELGSFSKCDWFQSNLLPTHTAGTLGEDQTTLTVVSINAAGTEITFSGAGTDADAVKTGDLFTFQDNVSGESNIRFLTDIGKAVSQSQVQFRATANAVSSADSVTISIYPPLVSTAGAQTRNISVPVSAGMQVLGLRSHRAGLIYSGNPLFIAMPQLPDESPFATANSVDPDTGISIRMYGGSVFGQNTRGLIHDCIWGRRLVPKYSFRLIFPM
jgi:hypothetical protein